MDSLKLIGILALTVVVFLALLQFKVSFGVALALSLAAMAAVVKYIRRKNPEDYADPDEEEPEDANLQNEDNNA